jgi:hypothetical protein
VGGAVGPGPAGYAARWGAVAGCGWSGCETSSVPYPTTKQESSGGWRGIRFFKERAAAFAGRHR